MNRKNQTQIVRAFKENKNQGTIGDLLARTNLSRGELESALPPILRDYRGHIRVSDTGEMFYHFPMGMVDRQKGLGAKISRFFSGLWNGIKAVSAFLFKIWIVVMLVGYFILFLALLVLGIAGSMAGQGSNRSRSSRSSGAAGGFIFGRIMGFVLRIWLYSGIANQKKKKVRPLHLAAYSFVFGKERIESDYQKTLEEELPGFIRGRKGILVLEDVMEYYGCESAEADLKLNDLLIRFDGQPKVSQSGSLYFFFPELMRTSGSYPSQSPTGRPMIPFSENEKATNGWLMFFNAFNLVFGSYFLLYGLEQLPLDGLGTLGTILRTIALDFGIDPMGIFTIGLGIVPLVYSLLFFGIPLIRNLNRKKKNDQIKEANFRRHIISSIKEKPCVTEGEFLAVSSSALPIKPKKRLTRILADLTLGSSPDITEESGFHVYRFPELGRKYQDVSKIRSQTDFIDAKNEKSIYDSNENL